MAAKPRANWKGFLKIGELVTSVALYTAASSSERIAFHTINRATGNRVSRQFVDSETGKPVERGEQVKGYEVGPDDYVVLQPEEVAAAVPESDKTLTVSAFVGCDDVDTMFFDKPYYLAPADPGARESFALVREGMAREKVAAIAGAVLFRRVRTLVIRPQGPILVANTLNFDYEVRDAEEAFREIKAVKIEGEMLDLAEHIIRTKSGSFDPAAFDDRYENALAELVKAKLEGRPVAAKPQKKPAQVIDLMAALRESAGIGTGKKQSSAPRRKSAPAQRKKAG